MTKVAIVGNRSGWQSADVYRVLNRLGFVSSASLIVSGGAGGVDEFAYNYARFKGIPILVHFPDPALPSPRRYFERNGHIVADCDVLVAFNTYADKPSGTLNTINHARRRGIRVIQITLERLRKEEF